VGKILPFLKLEPGKEAISQIRKILTSSSIGIAGVEEVEQVMSSSEALGIPADQLLFDPTLARGLDYYTGAIFETVLTDHPHMGSITGGGRYDGLIGMFLGKDIPATGSTIGVDRMMAVMRQLNLIPKTSPSAKVLVVLFDQDGINRSMEVTAKLRNAGIATELYPDPVRLKKQFQYADRKNIPYVVVPGPEEWSRSEVTLKNMVEGKQTFVSLDSLISEINKPENNG
jgi:histidyl-tRNA synthetase